MKHSMSWIEKHCIPFVTYDDEFQIWKQKNGEKYWAYDEDEEKFIAVKLIARETFSVDVDDDILFTKYDNDWCGEVDNSWTINDDETETFDYAWFDVIEEE